MKEAPNRNGAQPIGRSQLSTRWCYPRCVIKRGLDRSFGSGWATGRAWRVLEGAREVVAKVARPDDALMFESLRTQGLYTRAEDVEPSLRTDPVKS